MTYPLFHGGTHDDDEHRCNHYCSGPLVREAVVRPGYNTKKWGDIAATATLHGDRI